MAAGEKNPLPNLLTLGTLTGPLTAACFATAGFASLPPVTQWNQPTTWTTILVIDGVLWLVPTLCVIAAGLSGIGVRGLGSLIWFRNPAGYLTLLALISVPVIGLGLVYHNVASAIGTIPATVIGILGAIVVCVIALPVGRKASAGIAGWIGRRASARYKRRVVAPVADALSEANKIAPGTLLEDEGAQALALSTSALPGRIGTVATLGLAALVAPSLSQAMSARRELKGAAGGLDGRLHTHLEVGELRQALEVTENTLLGIAGVETII